MFYLMMHSTYFMYGYLAHAGVSLNIHSFIHSFIRYLASDIIMVKGHSDS